MLTVTGMQSSGKSKKLDSTSGVTCFSSWNQALLMQSSLYSHYMQTFLQSIERGENLGAQKQVEVSIKWFNGPWKPEERLGCHGSLLKETYRARIMSFHKCLVLFLIGPHSRKAPKARLPVTIRLFKKRICLAVKLPMPGPLYTEMIYNNLYHCCWNWSLARYVDRRKSWYIKLVYGWS